jgi:hypothetical protein
MEKLHFSTWRFLKFLRAPLLAALVVLSYTIANLEGAVLSPEQISNELLLFFTRHGALVVAPICFLENFAPLNSWFPGALAILTAMSSTSGDITAALRMFFVIWPSSLLGLIASFCLGRFLHMRGQMTPPRELSKQNNLKNWVITLVVFFHPYTGSLHAFRSGASGEPWALSWMPILTAHFLWSIFWAVTTYKYGLWLYNGQGLLLLVWAYLLIWIIVAAIGYLKFAARKEATRQEAVVTASARD